MPTGFPAASGMSGFGPLLAQMFNGAFSPQKEDPFKAMSISAGGYAPSVWSGALGVMPESGAGSRKSIFGRQLLSHFDLQKTFNPKGLTYRDAQYLGKTFPNSPFGQWMQPYMQGGWKGGAMYQMAVNRNPGGGGSNFNPFISMLSGLS